MRFEERCQGQEGGSQYFPSRQSEQISQDQRILVRVWRWDGVNFERGNCETMIGRSGHSIEELMLEKCVSRSNIEEAFCVDGLDL